VLGLPRQHPDLRVPDARRQAWRTGPRAPSRRSARARFCAGRGQPGLRYLPGPPGHRAVVRGPGLRPGQDVRHQETTARGSAPSRWAAGRSARRPARARRTSPAWADTTDGLGRRHPGTLPARGEDCRRPLRHRAGSSRPSATSTTNLYCNASTEPEGRRRHPRELRRRRVRGRRARRAKRAGSGTVERRCFCSAGGAVRDGGRGPQSLRGHRRGRQALRPRGGPALRVAGPLRDRPRGPRCRGHQRPLPAPRPERLPVGVRSARGEAGTGSTRAVPVSTAEPMPATREMVRRWLSSPLMRVVLLHRVADAVAVAGRQASGRRRCGSGGRATPSARAVAKPTATPARHHRAATGQHRGRGRR